MVTRLEAVNMSIRNGETYHSSDVIEGLKDRDTMRQVTLYTTPEPNARSVFFTVHNRQDHAEVAVDLTHKPPNMPGLHAALDETQVDISTIDHLWNDLKIEEGHTFRIWLGGVTFKDRYEDVGYAEVTWVKPDAA